MVTSPGYLEIPLMTAERAWAYAMQRKQEATDAPYRVKRHVVTRLDKASKVKTLPAQENYTTISIGSAVEGGRKIPVSVSAQTASERTNLRSIPGRIYILMLDSTLYQNIRDM